MNFKILIILLFFFINFLSFSLNADEKIYFCSLKNENSFGGDAYKINDKKRIFTYFYTNQFGKKTYINLDLYIDKFNNEIFRAYYSPIELSKKIFVKDYNNTLKPFIERDWDYLENYMGRPLLDKEKKLFDSLFTDIENIKIYVQINKNNLEYIISTPPLDLDKYDSIKEHIKLNLKGMREIGSCKVE